MIDGIVSIARKGGTIQLIASPMLSSDDVHAIELGYQLKETIISNAFTEDFRRAIYELDDSALKLLAELIARGILDIRIAVTNSSGCYHDKLGILEDFDGNIIAFYGSANAKKGRELMAFFGGEVFHLPIEEALKRGYLVSYYYKPIFVSANEKEEGLFKYYSQKILSCFKDNV